MSMMHHHQCSAREHPKLVSYLVVQNTEPIGFVILIASHITTSIGCHVLSFSMPHIVPKLATVCVPVRPYIVSSHSVHFAIGKVASILVAIAKANVAVTVRNPTTLGRTGVPTDAAVGWHFHSNLQVIDMTNLDALGGYSVRHDADAGVGIGITVDLFGNGFQSFELFSEQFDLFSLFLDNDGVDNNGRAWRGGSELAPRVVLLGAIARVGLDAARVVQTVVDIC